IVTSIVAEYLFLAVISCMTGAVLATLASWGLSLYFFRTVAAISLTPMLVILVAVTAGTTLAGVLGCWGIFQRSALESLRAESLFLISKKHSRVTMIRDFAYRFRVRHDELD